MEFEFSQQEEKKVRANFSPSPLGELFGGHPQVTLNCPLAAIGAFVAASAEATFTKEDARVILPLLTGENYPQSVKDVEFDILLEPMEICGSEDDGVGEHGKKCPNQLMVLSPGITEDAVVFSKLP